MSVSPDVGDVGAIEHPHIMGVYIICRVSKKTAQRHRVQYLAAEGGWGPEKARKIDQFYFMPEGLSDEQLMAIRDFMVKANHEKIEAVRAAEAHYRAVVAMAASQGKVPVL